MAVNVQIASALEQRGYKELRAERYGTIRVVMRAYSRLLADCRDQMYVFPLTHDFHSAGLTLFPCRRLFRYRGARGISQTTFGLLSIVFRADSIELPPACNQN